MVANSSTPTTTNSAARKLPLFLGIMVLLGALALPTPATADDIQCVGTTCLGTCTEAGTLGVSINGVCQTYTEEAGGSQIKICPRGAANCVKICQDGWATSVSVNGFCTDVMCSDPFQTHATGVCQGPKVCDGGIQIRNGGECFGVKLCDGTGISINGGACIYVPETCTPGTPCISLDAPTYDPVSYYKGIHNVGILGHLGSVTLTLTTGQFVTSPAVAPNSDSLCSVFVGKPGIASCAINTLVPIQTIYEPGALVGLLFCIESSFIRVDANGDGTYDFGSPIYSVAAEC